MTETKEPIIPNVSLTVPSEYDGERLDIFLSFALKTSRAAIKKLFASHWVRMENKNAPPGKKVSAGASVSFVLKPEPAPTKNKSLVRLPNGRSVDIL